MNKLSNILLGCFITSIGVIVLRHAQIVTGGTAGLSLMLSYFFNISFASIFFLINIPFYIFSFMKMGLKFTLSTLSAVTVLSLITSVDKWLPEFTIPTLAGSIVGGLIIGFGLSIVFINGASFGGTNMLALFLQKKYNINPGKTNFVFDFLVVIFSFYSVGLLKGILSVLSIAITSYVISYFNEIISSNNQSINNSNANSITTLSS